MNLKSTRAMAAVAALNEMELSFVCVRTRARTHVCLHGCVCVCVGVGWFCILKGWING